MSSNLTRKMSKFEMAFILLMGFLTSYIWTYGDLVDRHKITLTGFLFCFYGFYLIGLAAMRKTRRILDHV